MRPSPRFVALSLVVLFALGCVGFAGATVVGPPAETDTQLNTSASPTYLSPPPEDVTREEFATAGVDVASAVGTDTERLEGEFAIQSFDRRFSAIDDSDQREALVEETVDAIEAKVGAIDNAQARSFEAYGDGTVPATTVLRDSVRFDEAGQQQLELLQHVRDTTRSAPDVSTDVEFQIRLANIQAETPLLSGPVSEAIKPATMGADDGSTLYVQATGDALVLATFDDGEFVRQATVRSERDRDAVDQFTLDDEARILSAFQRGEELYPWVFENAIGAPSVSGFGDTSVYVITANHPQGSFGAYLDGATTNAFHEYQTQRPAEIPVADVRTGSTERLGLTVEMTAESGPMRVTLVDDETDDPVDAAVSIDGQAVGSTGANGQLWTVQPTGEFRVTATTATGETAVVIVS